jgi:hypothetical protein
MARQSLRWTNWIVVDDGEQRTKCTLDQRYVRLKPGLSPSESFARNMEIALREQQRLRNSEYVFIIEDDDWYGPNYLASLTVGLMTHELVGEPCAPFYHVSKRAYSVCGNVDYAALCATAFQSRLINKILPLIDPWDTELDRRIWTEVNCPKQLQQTRHCVGLKAQGGRPGLCNGHNGIGFTPDPYGTKLRKWIGDDAAEVLQVSSMESTGAAADLSDEAVNS